MRLTTIRAFALSSPIDPPQRRAFYGGTRTLLKRDTVLVVVETADGQQGVAPGAASSSAMREYFEGVSHETTADVVNDRVAPKLEGESFDDVFDVHNRLTELSLPAALDAEVASALDVAVYDVIGKRRGAPIHELLRERYGVEREATTSLPLYASAGMYMPPEEYVEQAENIAALGFSGYKYRPGLGPEADLRTVELLDDAVGDDLDLMLDAHTWWKLGERSYGPERTRHLLAEIAAFDPCWVEEPVEPDDYDGYRRLATETGVPLAGGESEPDSKGLCALAETGAVSFLQGDVRHHRGYTGCWQAVERCRGTDLEFVPHNFGTWLGLVANAHLVAAAPDASLLEYPIFEDDPALAATDDPGMYSFDLAFDVLSGTLDVSDGRLAVPEGPGLGVEVDLSVVEEYPFVEGPWTEFDYDDGVRPDV